MEKLIKQITEAQATVQDLEMELARAAAATQAVYDTLGKLKGMGVTTKLVTGKHAEVRSSGLLEMVKDLSSAKVKVQITLDIEVQHETE